MPCSVRMFPVDSVQAVWPPPPSGDHSVPQEVTRSLAKTVSATLGCTAISPTADLTATLQSMAQWTEHHCVVETRFNNVAPRDQFSMTIQPRKGERRIPSPIAIALAVGFPHQVKPFAVDFTFSTRDRSQRQVAPCIPYPGAPVRLTKE